MAPMKNFLPVPNIESARSFLYQTSWFFQRPLFNVLRHLRRRNVGRDDADGLWDWSSSETKDGPCLFGSAASDLIRTRLLDEKPFMAARFGNTEIDTILPYHLRSKGNFLRKSIEFVRGTLPYFWWEYNTLRRMMRDSGFFPLDKRHLEHFCRLMLNDIREIDVLGSWLNKEKYLADIMCKPIRVPYHDFLPFQHVDPWTAALEGKVVLVIHPFAETIESQYKNKRRRLFKNRKILPVFELKTLKAVQTVAGTRPPPGMETWFDAYHSMAAAVERIKFDIAIIGCGAYGLPLAAHVKRLGKKSVHLAGMTQILFGIKGARWDKKAMIADLYNESWVSPSPAETPKQFKQMEDGCYW